MKLLIKYPTRSRPKEFLFALDKYVCLLNGSHKVEIIVSADADDASMNNEEIMSEVQHLNRAGHITASIYYGNSKSKIEACNADMDKAEDWDVVLLASDDMIPRVQGYDDIILSEMLSRFPDTDGALFFNDGTDTFKRNLCTITIFGRKYYERFGYLYHPAYKSYFCDNEQTDVGQMLGRMPAIDHVIIKNEHPFWGGNFQHDALYKKNDKDYKYDERVYHRRKRSNFEITVPDGTIPSQKPFSIK